MDAIVDRNLDRCEHWLEKWIEEGNQKAVFFYLRTTGGYAFAREPKREDAEPNWESPDLDLPEPMTEDEWEPPKHLMS